VTTTDQDAALAKTPSEEPSRPPSSSRTMVLGLAGVLAAGAGVAALAVATLAADGNEVDPTGRPGATQHDSTPATDRTAEDAALPGASTCLWTSDVDTPVFPAEDLGSPPSPASVLTFERCDGEWTGRMAWSTPGGPGTGPACPDRVSVEAAGGDDSGYVNPWAAGNAAVARYLCEQHRDR